jgi:chromosome segregation ATPase
MTRKKKMDNAELLIAINAQFEAFRKEAGDNLKLLDERSQERHKESISKMQEQIDKIQDEIDLMKKAQNTCLMDCKNDLNNLGLKINNLKIELDNVKMGIKKEEEKEDTEETTKKQIKEKRKEQNSKFLAWLLIILSTIVIANLGSIKLYVIDFLNKIKTP